MVTSKERRFWGVSASVIERLQQDYADFSLMFISENDEESI